MNTRAQAAALLKREAEMTLGRSVAPLTLDSQPVQTLALTGPALLPTVTASDFCAGGIAPPDYMVPPLVVRGGMSMPFGQPKAGKTTLVAHMAAALLDPTRPFLDGVKPLEGDVLWLDMDQPWRVSQRRFAEAGATSPRLHIYRGPAPSLSDLLRTLDELQIELLVADNLARWLMLESENDNAEINRKLTPIQHALQERDITSIVIAHAGKGDAPAGKNLRGGSHTLSAVDIAIEVKAEGPPADGRRRLCFTSREEIVPDMIVRLANGRFVSEGTAKAAAFNARADDIIKGIRFGHNRKETLAEFLKVSTKTLEGWVVPLLKSGQVSTSKAAERGAPVIYSVPILRTSQNFAETSESGGGLL